MWGLIVGLTGLLIVTIATVIVHRRSTTSDERSSHTQSGSSVGLAFLIFFVVPGILAIYGVGPDPVLGVRTYPLLVAVLGFIATLITAVVGFIVVRRNTIPAKRGYLIRLWFYIALSFLVFFTIPGILAEMEIIPDPLTGLAIAAELLFFFFLGWWSAGQLKQIRATELARSKGHEPGELSSSAENAPPALPPS